MAKTLARNDKLEFFDYKGDFIRHLIFEKGIFLISITLIICAGVVFLRAAKICERSVDKYNDSIINLYKSIEPSEIAQSAKKGRD